MYKDIYAIDKKQARAVICAREIKEQTMRAIDAFNTTNYGHDQYGAFEDGWNAALREIQAEQSCQTCGDRECPQWHYIRKGCPNYKGEADVTM